MNERELMFPEWQPQYFAAISDGPPDTLRDRVEDAEKAIVIRLAHLTGSSEREVERFAIKDALDTLYGIKIKKLNFPEWKPPKTIGA